MVKTKQHIISTKALSQNSTSRLENAGFSVSSYEAVLINFNSNTRCKKELNNNAIPLVFTSKNGVKAALFLGLKPKNCYAISPVTSEFAKNEGFNLKGTARDSKSLAELIITNKEKRIAHLTSKDRRKELSIALANNQIELQEYILYSKEKNIVKHKPFHAILVFAPSHLDSFLMTNKIETQEIYCIGKTTANYALKNGFSKVKHCKISSENHLVDFAIQDMTNE